MITENDIPQVVQDVKDRLSRKSLERHLPLELEDRDYHLEDDWLLLSVTPTQEGVHPFLYAELLGEIEAELRKDGVDNVLLVPTLPD
jgi:hypothetical protein